MKPSTEQLSLGHDRTMKFTRDPITLYPMVELCNAKIVLKKGTTLQDVQNKPLSEIKEAQL